MKGDQKQDINEKLKSLTRDQANELADHLNDAMNAAMIADAERLAATSEAYSASARRAASITL